MAAPHEVPVLGPHSTFSEDIDHWSKRVGNLFNNTQSLELEGSASWSSSFFACLSPIDTCFVSCCCPCITFGKTHHRLHKSSSLSGYSPVNASCLGFWASAYCCLTCIPLMLQRGEIRKRANPHLSGETATDLLKAVCCACCDLVQQDKEAEHLLKHDAAGNGLVNQQPMVKQDMAYSAPTAGAVEAAPVAAPGTDATGAYPHDQKVTV